MIEIDKEFVCENKKYRILDENGYRVMTPRLLAQG